MTRDTSNEHNTPPLVASGGGLGKPMLLAGVVGACALGVGAGLWARPHEAERRATAPVAAKVAEAPKTSRTLEIVVEDGPAPLGAPIEVLPAVTGRVQGPTILAPAVPPSAERAPLAPTRPPVGLVRVQAVAPAEVEPAAAPAPAPAASPARAESKPARPPTRVARSEAAAKPKPATAERAQPSERSAKVAPARRAKVAPERALAKADPPRRTKAAKAEKPVKLAKAEVKPEKTKKTADTTKTARKAPSRISRALAKVAPKKVQQAATASKVRLAEVPKPKAEKPKARAAKTRVEKAALRKPVRPVAATPKPAPKLPKPTRDNPVRKASNRCASQDPGAALVCADPRLGAADRQLTRAYQQAEAAGVSAAQLARQQQRWLAARAQAAREAPWAVRDVYEARIAELDDQTRDARREF
ncbi:hypothetical protein [Phenylobacterium sp.]|jgi:hypothetical protein|uniref:hypothetical protein n=1 Tax=Phenylobacterium sp. TaxID=1871053 RepID=UPI002F95E6FC